MSAHVVETLRLELRHRNGRSATRGHDFHERVLRFVRGEGLRQLEQLFDHWAPRLAQPTLARLELDLGCLRPSQDEREWQQRLASALEAALQPLLARQTPALLPATPAPQSLRHFMAYLEQGHLPWQLSATPHGSLSRWLASLVHQQGPALWRALERHPSGPLLLRRLRQISPHQGLQALLAQRDPRLGQQLAQLDEQALLPLQARGRLSAYERQRLQQVLRAEALDLLWEARGRPLGEARRQRLLQALQHQLGRALGAGWQARLEPLAQAPGEPGLLQDLLRGAVTRGSKQDLTPMHSALSSMAHDAFVDTDSAYGAAVLGEAPSRVWEASLQRLRPWLDAGRPLSELQQRRVLRQLGLLSAHHRQALAHRLRQWAQPGDARRRWALALSPASFAGLLGCLSPSAEPAAPLAPGALPLVPATPAAHWAESLRQTALRLQRQAAPGLRPGLSRLQALLMEACLDALARGERLPDHHAGWQRFWEAAWQRWEHPQTAPDHARQPPASEAPAAPPASRPSAASALPTTTSANPSASRSPGRSAELPPEPWLPEAPPRKDRQERKEPTAAAPSPASALDRALQGLARQCESGRWHWPQRLRLARLLSTEQACARWLRLFDESRRWQMIRAQFGAASQALQQRAGRLLRWLGHTVREPAAALAEHWRRLARALFLDGRSPTADALREAYQQTPGYVPETASPPVPPVASKREPIWVDDAGQVLLAAYAERLFKHLDLLEQGRFKDDLTRAQAVQALQRLCHGEQAREDCDTALSRLLCGVAPSALLPDVAPPSAETSALLDQMLQAVIAHWKALGSTSVAGLRETFLQRRGRLLLDRPKSDAPPAWRLRVEKRGFDVLLDRLPWSFSTIRLPWMEGVLHVEWR